MYINVIIEHDYTWRTFKLKKLMLQIIILFLYSPSYGLGTDRKHITDLSHWKTVVQVQFQLFFRNVVFWSATVSRENSPWVIDDIRAIYMGQNKPRLKKCAAYLSREHSYKRPICSRLK